MNNTTLTREQALKVIKQHGWNPNQQTAVFNGVWVDSGSSFNEQKGIKETYEAAEIYAWLGY